MAMLVILSGALPYSTPLILAEGETGIQEPIVTKDVDGEESREVIKGEEYQYNINVKLPENLSNYESLTISDTLDTRVDVQGTTVLLNGQVIDSFQAVVDGQNVSLALTAEQLRELAEKEVRLQITSTIKEDATSGEKIDNIAQVVINGSTLLKTNSAVVIPVDSEEKDVIKPNESKEEDGETGDDNYPARETSSQLVNENDSSASSENSDVSIDQVEIFAESITLNEVDSYGSASDGKIYQIDGNDPTVVKGTVTITGITNTSLNGLAISENEDFLYAARANNLYRISPDGSAQFVDTLAGGATNAVIYNGKYLHSYLNADDGKYYLGTYDLTTGEKSSKEIIGYDPGDGVGGDLVVDSDGYLWFAANQANAQGTYIAQMNPETAEVIRVIPITPTDGRQLEGGVRGISFLPSGEMLLNSGPTNTHFTLFILDPETLSTTYLTTVNEGGLSVDLASRVSPEFDPFPPVLESEKQVEIFEKALGNTDVENPEAGDTLLYTIQTRNTVEEYSLIKELVISDTIPEGLEYVAGTLLVDGEAVTDEADEDKGQVVNNEIIGEFGDVLDNDWHTVEFQVTVQSGQEGRTIENIATVDALNTEPDNPQAEVDIYPRLPVPDACAAPVALINGSFEEGPERGSYQASGIFFYESEVPGWFTTDDSQGVKLIEQWNYKLGLPAGVTNFSPPVDGDRWAELNAFDNGLLYQDVETTPGQTIYWRLSHMGRQGDDTMQVRIGPATDNPYDTTVQTQMTTGNTAWETYTGSYTVPAGQTTTRFGFEAVSTGGGSLGAGNFLDDIFLGTEPCVVAEKSVSPEGEVFAGQELTYEVNIKNNGGDIAADTTFEDAIPAGTEYVPGSLKIIDGPGTGDLTDEAGDDAGHFDGEKVIVELGNLPNTNDLPNGITVQFKVKTLDTDTEKQVTNKAQISYDNLLENTEEQVETNEVTNTVLPKEEIDACAAPIALVNGEFEKPEGPGTYDNSIAGGGYYYADTVPGWETTDVNRTPRGIIQIMDPARPSTIPSNTPNKDNLTSRFAELNADTNSMLYQELPTIPGQTIYWRLNHRGYNGVDTMSVNIGSVTADPFNTTPEIERISTGTTWETYTGTYTVPAGQTMTRFGFKAISTSTGALAFGNYLDDVFLGTEPCVVAEKSVSPEGEVLAGDELTYEVTVKNNGGDIAANTIFEDAIPAGTEYVPGSLKIIDGPGTGDLTDEAGDDAGHFDGEKVIVELGDLPNINELPDGITVQFKVKALVNDEINEIVNQAQVGYDNLLTNERKETESNEVNNPLTYQQPDLESEKTSEIHEKAEGNTDADHPEVGDILTYRIQTRNTVENSLVTNLTISDIIPEGLEYVAGTLNVDGEGVTDEAGDDAGHNVDGNIFGEFGDVTDTEWHTLTFQVVVGEGQASQDIINIATVDGDNIDDPDKPEHEVNIYPREPNLESEKNAVNLEIGKEKLEVGDTVVYTIQSRNTVTESVVENFVISDVLPEGLTYVEGSMKVSNDGEGTFENGTITATFGDVADTEWRTVSFLVTVDSGQSGKTIENTATVNGDNVEEPDEPSTDITIDPKTPILESEKAASIAEKADGNTDAEHPEVGDTLTYTIQTRNTVEDSLVSNLTISDVLPEGLKYVEGTLIVDGQAVTDTEGDDAGHVVDRDIFGQFGNVTDTEWHTLTFQVVVGAGQAGQDIENIATVDGDNIDDPDKPREEVLVYPREPRLESEKTSSIVEKGEGNTDTDKYQVGDTIEYTIQSRNTVRESVVENFVISDQLPEGLTFVEESLEVSHEGTGNIENGTITASFGDVTDTEWRTITFQAVIESGQSGKTIENTATVDGDNVDDPDTPENEIIVDPKEPVLESEKASSIAEKAEGNTDAEHPEVGDTLTYTIQTRNTIEDSLVSNLTISDVLPEGLEYVAGTLTVDGQAVTDAEGDDAGHVVNKDIFGQFGNVTDTEWHTLTFQVVVGAGQAGQDIENIATVDGDNIDDPDKPREEVLVYPREPKFESEKTSSIVEKGEGNTNTEKYQVGDTIEYTIQSRNTVTESIVENFVISDELPEGLTFVEGSLEVSHEGTGNIENETITASFGDVTDTEWRTVTFQATIDAGQSGKTIENTATVDGDNVDDPDTPENEIIVDPKEPKLESEKASEIHEKAEGNTDAEHPEVGDTLTYTIQTRNTIEDSLVSNLAISDVLPEGLEYVAGTLIVDGESVTDAEGDDTGHSVDGNIFGKFGDVTDTEWHTLTFQVVVGEGQASQDITNIATVDGDNIDDPDKPEHEVNIYPREPNLESEKTAVNLEIGKERFEVGDTVVYTIQSRNTVTDSVVENFVLSDVLPEGLTYVEGSIKVSHDGEGMFENGTITATFGDVTDTEWRTVSFLATIDSGLVGNTIENVATADGDNVDDPDKPSTDITIDPKEPKLESTKTSSIAKKADGNTDAEHPEVGDTLTYTIQTRNTIEDSLVSNLSISDVLPKGLEYVAGTLTVDGQAVTDTEGDDAGHSVDGEIIGKFGDVTDTGWHTLTFQVVVKEGQAGQDIENIATVDGDNIDDPDKPNEEVLVYPREPKLESEKTAVNLEEEKEEFQVGDTVVYTIQARNTVKDSIIENLEITDVLPEGLVYVEGSLEVSEGGTGDIEDGTITAVFGDVTNTEWHTVTFRAKIESGQSGKSIENVATVNGKNIDEPDQPSEEITVNPHAPKLESEKTAVNLAEEKEEFQVGDTVVYTIQARNTVKDSIIENLEITDVLPEGLAYLEGSLEVSHEGTADIDGGTITASFGDVTDTEWRTVTFHATIETGYEGTSIENVATVEATNIEVPGQPTEEIVVEEEVTSPPDPSEEDPQEKPEVTEPKQPEQLQPIDDEVDKEEELPNTATNNMNLILVGLLLLLSGATILYRKKKKGKFE
ncbi:isopeptide-forming domain-containing fimbrial protein [Gracilibacillus dipsosauri]|nr:isopeptide-forming domain-containing fimbrial protein [Gracilibacillus dipsosauri]